MAKTKQNLPSSLVYDDGTEVRLVPPERTGGRALYVSANGTPFSYVRNRLRPLVPAVSNYPCSKANGRRKQFYLKLRNDYGCIFIHHAVALAFIGPQPMEWAPPTAKIPSWHWRGYECHHLNGITTDNRPSNLIWLSQAEHRRFDAALANGRILTREAPATLVEYEMTHHCEC